MRKRPAGPPSSRSQSPVVPAGRPRLPEPGGALRAEGRRRQAHPGGSGSPGGGERERNSPGSGMPGIQVTRG